jgi:hypothetical protein
MALTQTLRHPATETILPSAARAAAQAYNSEWFHNHEAEGVLLSIIVTAVTSTPLLTAKIQYSPDGGTTAIDYAAFTQVGPTNATNYSLLIDPAVTTTTDGSVTESVSLPLPRLWRLVVTHADTDSATYSVQAMYL